MAFLNKKHMSLPWVLFLCLVCCSGCNSGKQTDTNSSKVSKTFDGKYPIRIVCTTGMVADILKNVAGEHAQVTYLMRDRTDPHQYKASPGDLNQLTQADMIFYSGLHLEGKMGEIFKKMSRLKPTHPVTEEIPTSKLIEIENNNHDPHLWFDVSLWSETSISVEKALSKFDPEHAADYQKNREQYQDQLAKLHQECLTRILEIPSEKRVLVTAHDAFGYFSKAYQIEVKAIQGISTETEAGVKEINELVNYLVSKKIKAVFVETSISDRNIQSLIEGCAAQNHQVTIGGELFSDAMGEEGSTEETYQGMIRHNLKTIVEALR